MTAKRVSQVVAIKSNAAVLPRIATVGRDRMDWMPVNQKHSYSVSNKRV